MAFVNLLLDLAGLLLWLSFRRIGAEPARPAGTLLGNLRPAAPAAKRSWYSLLALILLLALRPLVLASLAPTLNDTPTWSPGPLVVAFRADDLTRLYLFSSVSFGWTALVAYSILLGFCWVCRGLPELQSFEKFGVNLAGPIARLPGALPGLAPIAIGAGIWLILSRVLERQHLLPPTSMGWHRLAQALLIGLSAWLPIRWAVLSLLLLRLLHNYVYLGEHAFWTFVQSAGRRLQVPVSWLPLQIGRMDLGPLAAGLLYWELGELALRGLTWAFPLTLG